MLELHSFKNLNILSFLKYVDNLSVGIKGKSILDTLNKSLSIQERLLLLRLSKTTNQSIPNYVVEFQEDHALNSNFDWIASLNSIDDLELRLNKTDSNDYLLKKTNISDHYKLYLKGEYYAYIRPIQFLSLNNKKTERYERFIKRLNKSNNYQEVDQLFKGHTLFGQLDGYGDQFTVAQAEDLNYGYRAYTSFNTLCATAHKALKPFSDKIKLGHCFEMLSVLLGHANWNTFKASQTYNSLGNGIPAAIMKMDDRPTYQHYKNICSALSDSEALLSKGMAHETKILPAANHISILQTPHYDAEYDYVTPFTKGSVYITSIVPWESYIGPHY